MIYFLINNNYHLDLDYKLAKQLAGFDLGLIQVPYSLNVVKEDITFSKIHHFPYRIFLSRPLSIINAKKNIDRELRVNTTDILLVHTDSDFLNHYIIQKFYDAGSKVYFLEDGPATMCTFNVKPQAAPFKEKMKALLLKHIYGFRYTDISVFAAETLPVMDDSLFSGVIVNWGNDMLRKIPLYKLVQHKIPFEILYKEGAIFYNQSLYFWYCTEEQYISYLDEILGLSENFSPFYFKFHPADTDQVKEKITRLITKQYPKIKIILDDDFAESVVDQYPVQYAITFNSTAALNQINRGIETIFLNNLFHKKFPNPIFTAFDVFTTSIGCAVPSSLAEVKPGFRAFDQPEAQTKTYTIKQILNI